MYIPYSINVWEIIRLRYKQVLKILQIFRETKRRHFQENQKLQNLSHGL